MRDIQKFLSLLLVITFVAATLLVSGCTETLDDVEEEMNGEQMETENVSINDIIDIEWQWSGLIETEPASQSVVPDPENYTIVFSADGTYSVKADCNSGTGNYTVEENDLTINPGPMTLAYCGPESLDSQYMALLINATSFTMENDQLVLFTGEDDDKMLFAEGETI
jgi:heat shock protein HslJ